MKWQCSWEGEAVGANRRIDVHATTVRGRVMHRKEYMDFKDGLAWTFKAHRPAKPYTDWVQVTYRMRIHPSRDFDSLFKPIGDALQSAGIIKNDRQIRGKGGWEVEDKEPGELDRIEVVIE